MNPLSLAPLSVLPASPLELIDTAHAAGFDAVVLRLHPAMEFASGLGVKSGEGSLPLYELLDALPPGIPLCLEVPNSQSAQLPLQQRVDVIAASAWKPLRAHEARRA